MSDIANPLEASTPEINAVVDASAGTGKTYLLVTRVIRLLLAGAPADRILALTFTRKAAGEMRHRLHERLRMMAMADDAALQGVLDGMGLVPDAGVLDRARRLYEQILLSPRPLRISTFHAFCQQLLQRFPLEADVPPGYELLQAGSIVQTAAWDALFLEATRNPDSAPAQALETLFIACNGRLDSVHAALMQGFLARRNDWLAYTQGRGHPVEHASEQLRQLLQMDPAEPLHVFFRDAAADLSTFRDLLLRHATDTNSRHADLIEAGLNPESALETRFESVKGVFLTLDMEPRQRKISKALEKSLAARAAEFLQLHDTLCRRILSVHESLLRREYWKTASAWYRAGNALLQHYQRIKQEQRLLDFDDLEWKSCRLLRHRDHGLWVQYKIDQKIDHLLIDEFQDTNPTQWRLLLPLLEEMADADPGSGRLRSIFLVGDGKQSIYSFRRADPQLQEAAAGWLKERMQARKFALDKSRRSAAAIMQTLNYLFEGTALGGKLHAFETHSSHRSELWGQVEILPCIELPAVETPAVPSGLRDALTTAKVASEPDLRYLEGLQIAHHIHEIVENGYIVEKSAGGSGPADYDDIFILFRARTHIAAFEQALTEHAIPFASLEKGTLLEQQEVEDIEALLNVLLTPFNNLALAQVLKSPIFGATDADLMLLSTLQGDWYGRLKIHAEDASGAGRSPALLRAWRLLATWRKLLPELPLHDLLDRIFHQGDIIARYRSATPTLLANRVISNLQRLLALALEIDSGRYPSLSNFLLQLRRIRASDQDQPDTPPLASGERRVRLMTIHAAKGLEAPVVFVADTRAATSRNDSFQALVDWPHTADRPEHFLLYIARARMPSILEPLLERQRQRQSREQANLLYVALSRAKQMLFISGSGNNIQDATESGDWYSRIVQALKPHATRLPGGGYRITSGDVQQGPRSARVAESRDSRLEIPLPSFTHGDDLITPGDTVEVASDTEILRQQPLGRQHGTVVHKMLEMLAPPEAVHALELDAFLDYGLQRELLTTWQKEARAVLAKPELQFLFNPELYDRAYKEVPLIYRTDTGAVVHGLIDRVVIQGNDVWLIDYKTRRAEDALELQELARHYRPQLLYYAEGLRKIWPGKNVRPAILLTGSQTLLEIE
ncbi:MAG TPA: UvrD-helicase domain-containing protein [Gammaproteobacteria bacterium]|nr:UvrD-helicase domain-containing protein [Gammaproteobacteria bacterium]